MQFVASSCNFSCHRLLGATEWSDLPYSGFLRVLVYSLWKLVGKKISGKFGIWERLEVADGNGVAVEAPRLK